MLEKKSVGVSFHLQHSVIINKIYNLPLFYDRIEAIARDSDLQDKSKADLARVIDHVLVRCEQAFNQEIDETAPAGGYLNQLVEFYFQELLCYTL